MEPITIIAVITAVIPFATAAIKKIFKTEEKKGFNALAPIILGILSAGVYEYGRSGDVITALVVGLGSGGAASSARDIDKNLIGIVESLLNIFGKKKAA